MNTPPDPTLDNRSVAKVFICIHYITYIREIIYLKKATQTCHQTKIHEHIMLIWHAPTRKWIQKWTQVTIEYDDYCYVPTIDHNDTWPNNSSNSIRFGHLQLWKLLWSHPTTINMESGHPIFAERKKMRWSWRSHWKNDLISTVPSRTVWANVVEAIIVVTSTEYTETTRPVMDKETLLETSISTPRRGTTVMKLSILVTVEIIQIMKSPTIRH